MKLLRFFIIVGVPVLFFSHCTASPQTQQSSSQEEQNMGDVKTVIIEKSEPLVQEKPAVPIAALEKSTPKEEPSKPVQKEESAVQKKLPEPPKPESKKKEPKKEEPRKEGQKVEPKKEEPKKERQKVEPKKEEPKKERQKVEPPKQEEVKKEDKNIIAEFEGIKITKETYTQTKSEIELVVDELNRITAKKDYNHWLSFLAPSYKDMYSNPVTLKAASETLPIKGIRLRTLKDYFLYVFVPSRQNIKVDDIQFFSPTQVNVLMLHGKDALLVYRIENTADGWKLIPSK